MNILSQVAHLRHYSKQTVKTFAFDVIEVLKEMGREIRKVARI